MMNPDAEILTKAINLALHKRQRHLRAMVIAEDPIKYIGENI